MLMLIIIIISMILLLLLIIIIIIITIIRCHPVDRAGRTLEDLATFYTVMEHNTCYICTYIYIYIDR